MLLYEKQVCRVLYRLSYKNRFVGFSLTCLRLHKRVSFGRTPVGCGHRRGRWPRGCGTSGCRTNAPSTDCKSCSGPKNTVIKIKCPENILKTE